MPLEIIASESIPSDAINDDRVGTLDNLAWVIDGATDIGDGPIIGERSDAAWLAEAAGTWLAENGAQIGPDLQSLLPELTGFLRSSFEHGKRRDATADASEAQVQVIRQRQIFQCPARLPPVRHEEVGSLNMLYCGKSSSEHSMS